MSDYDSDLQAVLARFHNLPDTNTRKDILKKLSDNQLSRVVIQGVKCEFEREGLEEIALVMLGVISKDSCSKLAHDLDGEIEVALKHEEADDNGEVVIKMEPDSYDDNGVIMMRSKPLLAMATIDAYLKDLLTLSGNEQLATPRQHLLQGINDDDLSELLKKAVGREFARGGLEDIVSVILDVIARDPVSVNGDGTGAVPHTSLKSEQGQRSKTHQQGESKLHCIRFFGLADRIVAEDEIMLDSAPLPVNEQSATSLLTTRQSGSNQPATGLLAPGQQQIQSLSSADIHRGSGPNIAPVSAMATPNEQGTSNDTVSVPNVSATKVSLFCPTEQIAFGRTVSFIDVIYRDIVKMSNRQPWLYASIEGNYCSFRSEEGSILRPLISERFEKDYLSKEVYVAEWGRYLRLREEYVASDCCVNTYVIGKTKAACQYSAGHSHETACDRCIKTKRLCARLIKINKEIKLVFFPLAKHLRPHTNPYSLGYWVCK
ncbi:hypothetical protein J4E89_009725 [Alternaria sp. Ai002NY15]|nr:hypothetical protein J4E89_009725 [Alternaria sp. Ai002NY15]